jgi:alkyl hydroperoxide reductase subunit AhpC
MALRLGDEAPNFQAETTEGNIDFHEWIGNGWAILFSHPADYTPVCTTELGYTAKLQPEFQKRGVKTIAVSVDSLEDHHGWINDINETQNTTVNFPIIADPDRAVATAYDMIHPNAAEKFTVRSVFVIDPNKKIPDDHLPTGHRPQLRRNFARGGRPATDRQPCCGHAGQLEGRGRLHRRADSLRRGGGGQVPERLHQD